MTDFDFSKVKATKSTTVPSLSRTRAKGPNPLATQYAESEKQGDIWLHMVLPGKIETEEYTDDEGNKKSRTVYGPTVKKACAYLRAAAADKSRGVNFRYEDGEDGTIILHYQAKPKKGADA